ETAGAVRRPMPTPPGLVIDDVVRSRAMPRRVGERVANLDPLNRLDAHHRRGQAAVEALVPLAVRAQADGQTVGNDLEDAAQGVTRATGAPDELGRLVLELLVATAHGRLFHLRPPWVSR